MLLVYHSQSGASATLARAAARGIAKETEVKLIVRRAWDADTDDLAACDGLLLVAAENSASLAGGMKDFLDRTFYPAIARQLVLPVALIISAGNDGRNARAQAKRILSGYPFSFALKPLILRGEVSTQMQRECEQYGEGLATGISMAIF